MPGVANLVRVWLGEATDNSDVAMDFLNKIHDLDFEDPSLDIAIRGLL